MGLDLYIEARITQKDTGRIISGGNNESNEGFFEICWWCSSIFRDLRSGIIEIVNRHSGSDYTDTDIIIPIPMTALREIYGYLLRRSFVEDGEINLISVPGEGTTVTVT